MATKMIRCFCVSLLLAAGAAGTFAQNTGSTTPAASQPTFQWGGDFRLRFEEYTNAQTLNSAAAFNARNYLRARLRVWETNNLLPGLTLFGRLSAEPRYWFSATKPNPGHGTEWKYAIIDSMNAKWIPDLSDKPVTVVLGRQDIQLGDQWLVTDGTPADGTWTNHFDALRVTIDAKSIKTKFEVIAFNLQAKPGDRIPVLGNRHDHANANYTVTEQDETGVILYASNKSIKDTQLDGYFIYKGDEKVASAGDNADIYTLGGKIAGTPTAHWQYSAEGAYQWGRRDLAVRYPVAVAGSRDISAYGLTAKVNYIFKDTYSNQLACFTEYLSGDKGSTTGTDEMFDVLWARVPRVGETWAAAYSTETGGRASQYNNLFRLGAIWSIAPTKATTIATTYCALFAPEALPTRVTAAGRARFSGDGHFRGHMLQVSLKHKFTKSLSGWILAEASFMGDYYAQQTTMTFLRTELLVTF